MTKGCVFCDHDSMREADLYFENEFCLYASTRDPRDPPDVMPGYGGIAPKVHRTSLFDLTAEEWAATRDLLLLVRASLHERLAPDSYTLGWNDNGLHPHLHLIPRFDDEPMCSISCDPHREEYATLHGRRARHRLHRPHMAPGTAAGARKRRQP